MFAVLPDFDKLLAIPRLLHSVFAVGVIGSAAFVLERRLASTRSYANVVIIFLASHLLLDFLDGGPGMFLYPLIETGVGLEYPSQIVFGDAVQNVAVRNPLPHLQPMLLIRAE